MPAALCKSISVLATKIRGKASVLSPLESEKPWIGALMKTRKLLHQEKESSIDGLRESITSRETKQ